MRSIREHPVHGENLESAKRTITRSHAFESGHERKLKGSSVFRRSIGNSCVNAIPLITPTFLRCTQLRIHPSGGCIIRIRLGNDVAARISHHVNASGESGGGGSDAEIFVTKQTPKCTQAS